MIISQVASPSHNLSKWKLIHLRPIIKDSKHNNANSLEFLERIKHISIAADECMASFDVTSLFTSASLGLDVETVIHVFDVFGLGLPPAATIDSRDHCLSNYFQVDSRFYQQIKCTSTGSPISELIAKTVLQRLEMVVFAVSSPKFWKRNVNDTFVIIKGDDLSAFH